MKLQTHAQLSAAAGRRVNKVSALIPLPNGAEWQKFLKETPNKDQLFRFVSTELQRHTSDARYQLLTMKGHIVFSNKPTDLSDLQPCKQEADARIQFHLNHAALQGHTKGYVRTVDSDIVVLAIHYMYLDELGMTELWIGFGTGSAFKAIPIHVVV